MAIQTTNLTLDRRAQKSTRNVDRVDDIYGRQHLAVACKFCDEEERLTLVEQNISFLQTCEDASASLTLYNETERRLLGPRLLCTIVKKWREQTITGFIRFLNGNMTDCRAANLQFVSLRHALFHFEEWTVDWYINLTEVEIGSVIQPAVLQLLVYSKQFLANFDDEDEDGTDATNNQVDSLLLSRYSLLNGKLFQHELSRPLIL